MTRRLSVSDSSSSILGVTTLAVTCAGFLTILIPPLTGWDYWTWKPMDLAHVAILALAGLLLGTGQYLMIESVRLAEIGLVAPFRYTSMLWAVAVGYLVYGTLPDHWVLTGAGLVIASGIYILHRETRVRAAPAAVGGRPDALPLHKDG